MSIYPSYARENLAPLGIKKIETSPNLVKLNKNISLNLIEKLNIPHYTVQPMSGYSLKMRWVQNEETLKDWVGRVGRTVNLLN